MLLLLIQTKPPYPERKVHSSCGLDRAMFRKSCMRRSTHLSFWALAQLLKREQTYTQEHCMDTSGCPRPLLVGSAATTLFQTQAHGWQPLLSGHATYTQTCPTDQHIWLKANVFLWTHWAYSRYFQRDRRSSLKPPPPQSTDREKSHVLGCLVQDIDRPEHTRESLILPKASVWFGLVTQVDLPALQNGRIRTTLPCNQVPDGLPTFLILLR